MKKHLLNPEDLRTKMRTQMDFIDEAIHSTRRDDLMDIATLDQDVALICDSVAGLPEATALQFEAGMAEMIGKLEKLADELQAFQERHADEFGDDDDDDGDDGDEDDED